VFRVIEVWVRLWMVGEVFGSGMMCLLLVWVGLLFRRLSRLLLILVVVFLFDSVYWVVWVGESFLWVRWRMMISWVRLLVL